MFSMAPRGAPGKDIADWLPDEAQLSKKLGAAVKALRKEQSLSQTSLANYVGVEKSLIADVEAGRNLPSVPVLLRLARSLGASADALLGTAAGGPPPLRDPRLVRCLREISRMEPLTLGYVIRVLDSLIDAYPILGKVTAEPAERESR